MNWKEEKFKRHIYWPYNFELISSTGPGCGTLHVAAFLVPQAGFLFNKNYMVWLSLNIQYTCIIQIQV